MAHHMQGMLHIQEAGRLVYFTVGRVSLTSESERALTFFPYNLAAVFDSQSANAFEFFFNPIYSCFVSTALAPTKGSVSP